MFDHYYYYYFLLCALVDPADLLAKGASHNPWPKARYRVHLRSSKTLKWFNSIIIIIIIVVVVMSSFLDADSGKAQTCLLK